MPFDLPELLKTWAAATSRRLANALTMTRPMIKRMAIPEAISAGSSQPGVARVAGAEEVEGKGVVTTACSAGTSVPTAENEEDALAVAIWVPFVMANTPVN